MVKKKVFKSYKKKAKDSDENLKLLFLFLFGILITFLLVGYYAPKTDIDDDFFKMLNDLIDKIKSQSPSNGYESGDLEESDIDADNYCFDTDDGKSYYIAGHIVTEQESYYDKCNDARGLTEYWCEGDNAKSNVFLCPEGYSCVETRSGGYCEANLDDPVWEVGDIISENNGGGTSSGSEVGETIIDMSSVEIGGDCRLGAKIWTSWNYVDENACWGIIGKESVEWVFFDAYPTSYSILALETSPQSNYHDLCPVSYDGISPWKLKMFKQLELPECEIEWTAKVQVYICECD